jgi:peptidoglycan/xylan/chitin deacetylase (PgdA/CDA1 family)
VTQGRGSLCISIDLELGWGIRHRPSRRFFELCAEHERSIVRDLLALFRQYDISATWAFVGRLLVPGKAPVPGTLGGGRQHDERIWYAPDIIDSIHAAAPTQDLGSHSYEHLSFREIDADRARSDLEAARAVHSAHGLQFTSFVYPRNEVGHIGVLGEMGIRVFRGIETGWYSRARQTLGTRTGQLANLLDKALPVPPPAVFPSDHALLSQEPLRELPGSMQMLSRNGARRLITRASTLAKVRKGLAAARQSGGVFHLWFHPSNFYYDTEHQLDTLAAVLAVASKARDRSEIEIVSMRRFAADQTVSLSR